MGIIDCYYEIIGGGIISCIGKCVFYFSFFYLEEVGIYCVFCKNWECNIFFYGIIFEGDCYLYVIFWVVIKEDWMVLGVNGIIFVEIIF